MNRAVAAIVKGLVEHGDKRRHFGSTLAFTYHWQTAVECGVVDENGVTDLGRRYYETARLMDLPDTRMTFWAEQSFLLEDL